MAKFITLENLFRFKKNIDDIIPTKTSDLENDSDFAVKDDIPDISNLATKDEIPDISNLAEKSEIPDVSNLAEKDEIPDVSNFITQEDIPDISHLATKDEIPDISNLAEQSDIPTKVSELENDIDFATKDEIPDISNLATKDELPNLEDFDLSEYAKQTDIPTKISELANDEGLIKNTVDNLTNYYHKTQTYTKDEINELVNKIPTFDIEVVEDPNALPEEERSETTIYLVPRTNGEHNDYYDEIIWIHNTWERIGSTKVNLSDYYTKTETIDTFAKKEALSDLAKKSEIPDISGLATKAEIPTDYARPSDIPDVSNFITQITLDNNYYTAGETEQLIEDIRDSIPTHLSQLQTDINNQRVSATEKATWNNKSNFSGSYNDLTDKPTLTNYLSATSINENITGRKVFIGSALQLAPGISQQPTFIEVDKNQDRFRVSGMWDFINLDGSTTYPTIRLMGYDIATKDEIPDISNLASKDEIPDISNLATKEDLANVSGGGATIRRWY